MRMPVLKGVHPPPGDVGIHNSGDPIGIVYCLICKSRSSHGLENVLRSQLLLRTTYVVGLVLDFAMNLTHLSSRLATSSAQPLPSGPVTHRFQL